MHEMNRIRGTISIEWPRRCTYWKKDEVVKTAKLYKLKTVQFDGCMVGVVSLASPGQPIKKPWRIDTNNIGVLKAFDDKMCKGHEGWKEHKECGAKDA